MRKTILMATVGCICLLSVPAFSMDVIQPQCYQCHCLKRKVPVTRVREVLMLIDKRNNAVNSGHSAFALEFDIWAKLNEIFPGLRNDGNWRNWQVDYSDDAVEIIHR